MSRLRSVTYEGENVVENNDIKNKWQLIAIEQISWRMLDIKRTYQSSAWLKTGYTN